MTDLMFMPGDLLASPNPPFEGPAQHFLSSGHMLNLFQSTGPIKCHESRRGFIPYAEMPVSFCSLETRFGMVSVDFVPYGACSERYRHVVNFKTYRCQRRLS